MPTCYYSTQVGLRRPSADQPWFHALPRPTAPGRNTIKETAVKETANLSTILPFAQQWKEAITQRDRPASIQAGEDYEARWQAVEVYINHRSVPLYTDIENDTQFVIDEGLTQPQPDWPWLLQLADRLCQQIEVAITFIAAQPPLSPLFDDLVSLRGVRAHLLISRNALKIGDLTKARRAFTTFAAGFPGIEGLIAQRSTTADQETKAAVTAAVTMFADPHTTSADLTPLVAALLNRYDFGMNLTNAAARAAMPQKTSITADDRVAIAHLNEVVLGLRHSLTRFPTDLPGAAAGGATGPGSDFAKVHSILESKARSVNTAATLRRALRTYQELVLTNPTPSTSHVAAANKTALEAVALAQQTLVGQFWTDPAHHAFLNTLPTI